MNKQCYRIIFNRERGMLMVVSDIAKSYGGAVSSGAGVDSQPVSRSLLARLRPLSFFTSLVLGVVMLVSPAQANIVADANAPGNQQPQIIASSNGTPQVNIQTPSAGGVSRNQYSQFDVNQKGVILNNSRNNVSTELGGFIAGNNNLAGGEARIILNEVNSRNPSQLNGYIEVAGQKAQVVIANPSGITCDGCGFINADRATLTTGKAELNNGHLQGYRVDKGQIKITGKGLDTSRQDYTELISRSVEVNTGIWANDVKVVTGRNQVSRDLTSVQALADDGSDKPTLAIDVAELGGMYAGKIHLIGTEQGVGVHNAGQLGASAGSVVVSADGKIVNLNKIAAQQNITISTQSDFVNQGHIASSQGQIAITGQGELRNSGQLSAKQTLKMTGQSIDNQQGSISAYQSIELRSQQTLNNINGTILSDEKIAIQANQLKNQHGKIGAIGSLTLDVNQTINNQNAELHSNNTLTLNANLLNNDNGKISATDKLQANIHANISNIQGLIVTNGALGINTHQLNNHNGKLLAGKQINFSVFDVLNNEAGQIYSFDDMAITAGSLNNKNTLNNGGLQSQGELQLIVTGEVNNQNGLLSSIKKAAITSQTLLNQQGLIVGGGIALNNNQLVNQQGQLLSTGNINITTQYLDNQQGLIRAIGDAELTAAQAIINSQTRDTDLGIEADNITMTTAHVDNQSGGVFAHQTLTMMIKDKLYNQQGEILSLGVLNINQNGFNHHLLINNNAGSLISSQLLALQADQLVGTGDYLSDGDIDLQVNGDLANTSRIIANKRMRMVIKGLLDNQGQLLAGNNLTILATDLLNQQTAEIEGGNVQLTVQNNIDNFGLVNGYDMVIRANQLNNRGSGRIYADRLWVGVQQLNNIKQGNQSGTIAARAFLGLAVSGRLLNQDHGLIFSGGDMVIGGLLDDDLRVQGWATEVSNHSSTIEAMNNLTLSTHQFNNINDNFQTEFQEVNREFIVEFQVDGSPNRYTADQVRKAADGHVTILITPDTPQGHHTHYEYRYTRVTQETVITETDPAKIVAGGNLTINADNIINDNSQIVAGQRLTLNAESIDNKTYLGQRVVTDTGQTIKTYRKKKRPAPGKGKRWYKQFSYYGYNDVPVNETFSFNGAEIAEHSNQTTDRELSNPSTNDQHNALRPDKSHLLDTILSELDQQSVQQGPDLDSTLTVINSPITLPDNSLFAIKPRPDAPYLIETDPKFSNYKKWLGSDYMYNILRTDPNNVLKRLGDGYYEQQLIREQITQLTGLRFLDGYSNDEAQFKTLMDNGIRFANSLQLTVGVALTAEQMAQLTDDIVWLVSREVTLPDGSIQKVLVPQIYIRPGQVQSGTGGLLSGKETQINVTGNFTNSGQVRGSEVINIQANNIYNTMASISGGKISMNALDSVVQQGGLISADHFLSIQAGNDITISSILSSHSSANSSYTNISDVGGLMVKDGDMQLKAGQNINLNAAQLINQGDGSNTVLQAGNDINFNTLLTEKQQSQHFDSKNYIHYHGTQEVGSQLLSNGNVSLQANNDINLKAAEINALEHVDVKAGNNLNITAGQSTVDFESSSFVTSSGFLSSQTDWSYTKLDEQTALGSVINGGSINLTSGADTHIVGSQVISDGDLRIDAGGDLNISAAEQNSERVHIEQTVESGLMSSGGIGVTIGVVDETLKQTDTERSYLGSMVGSTGGNVTLNAGKDLTVKGSDVIAQQDITATAQNIKLESVDEEARYKEEYRRQQTGLTLAITGTASDIYEAAKAVQSAQERGNDKTTALQSIKAGLTLMQMQQKMAMDELLPSDQQKSDEASIGIKASVGTQITERTVEQEQHTAIGSGLSAGNNITLTATGDKDGNGGDITLKGSEIKAGHDITLDANHDLNMIASVNTQNSDRKETSYGGSVGIGFALGGDESGLRFSGSANFSSEREKANGSAWSESIVDAGNKLTVKTGNDANLIGAQLKGDTVVANIGNNLNIQSLQDTDNFEYEKLSVAVDGSYGTGFSANLNLSMTTMDSNWASVTDQSGIFAGKGGYDIYVGNNTDLKGAVIASTAEDKNLNNLDTGTLSFSDIENKADYKVQHVSVSVSTSGPPALPTLYQDSDKTSSTTHSAVEQGNITIRDKDAQKQDLDTLSRDTDNANNVLGEIFDKQEHLDKIEQIGLVKDIVQKAIDIRKNQDTLNAMKALDAQGGPTPQDLVDAERQLKAEFAKEKAKDPNASEPSNQDIYNRAYNNAFTTIYNDSYKTTGMGSDTNKAIGAVGSILAGVLTGDITGGLAGAGAPYIAEKIKEATYERDGKGQKVLDPNGNPKVNVVANTLSHVLLGAVTAELQGGSAVAGGLGAGTGELAAGFIYEQLYSKDKDGKPVALKDLSEEDKERISMLASIASGMAVASTGGGSYDIVTGVEKGKTSAENNYLKTSENKETAEKVADAETLEQKKELWQEANVIDNERQYRVCESPEECRAIKDEIKADFAETQKRFGELDKKLGTLTEVEEIEYQGLLTQLNRMGSALSEANRQLREQMPSEQWTREEWEDTLRDISIATSGTYGGLGATSLLDKTALAKYSVKDLSKLKDPALNVDSIRSVTQDFIKSSYQDKGISYAVASVTVNGKTEYYMAVSGKAWSGNAPQAVNIGGVNYKVVMTDTKSIPNAASSTTQTNFNHAEQKLFSHIQDTYKGQKADVNVAVQNTSKSDVGMCTGCGSTSMEFSRLNPDFKVSVFQGSTKTTGTKP